MRFLGKLSDPTQRTTHALQMLTLMGILWIGVSLDHQADLTRTLIEQEQAMSTTYTDTDGLTHTVNTPYIGEGTAAQHRLDLKAAFCVFRPATAPKWWSPEDCR